MEKPQIDIFDEETDCQGCNARTVRIKQLERIVELLAMTVDKLRAAPSIQTFTTTGKGMAGNAVNAETSDLNHAERLA